jgi:hypothetical protein
MLVFLLELVAEFVFQVLVQVAIEIGVGSTGRKILHSWLGDVSEVSGWSHRSQRG